MTFPDLFDDDNDTLKEDVEIRIREFADKAGLMKTLWSRSDEENQEMDNATNDQIKDRKTGDPELEARLTKQLRVAVGLPAVSVP